MLTFSLNFTLVTTTATFNTPTYYININTALVAYILSTLSPTSYTYSSASTYPIPIPIDFSRSYAYHSSSPVNRVARLVYDYDDPTLTTITIILEEEDKEEEVVEYINLVKFIARTLGVKND
ncbi:hypothetical protein MYCTH_94694 [Thermothelomyces thermophilus ATCC 42464]|uniref:Uncharacterized protein n=1 Tax=Thermothelomyces thermophilus (strain ATCC 42464 / BCRC 31852 / DSM 1799) TaxID=573729 RepID=G2QFW8_THET4|nr:uncharacterized protein MYCTH_94694 [Thermothelomyces thermophilus ATCC 42464]AEO59282.1 hypothetical protein MYCTH_94694 [Thermothelomyces thermophilus ATCC 42464]